MSSLQLLTTKFKNMRMKEYETIFDFNIRLRYISNTYFALGEKMFEEKLVKKILRSLHRFDMKITTIEEAQDISTIKMDKLIRSLQIFQMAINDRAKNKNLPLYPKSKRMKINVILKKVYQILQLLFVESLTKP